MTNLFIVKKLFWPCQNKRQTQIVCLKYHNVLNNEKMFQVNNFLVYSKKNSYACSISILNIMIFHILTLKTLTHLMNLKAKYMYFIIIYPKKFLNFFFG